MKKMIFLAIAVFAAAFLTSCDDKEIPIDTNTYYPGSNFSYAASIAQCESMSHDILITALRFATDTTLWHRSGYPVVTATSATAYPRTVTVDFGNDDTTALIAETSDIRTRSGILQIQLNANWHANGSSLTVNANNYRLSNMMTFSGRIGFANRGLHDYYSNPCYTFEYVINEALISYNNAEYALKYSSSKIYYLTVGESTLTVDDDVFHISGTASIQKDTNFAYLSITSDYYAPYNCFWFRDGEATITEGTINRSIKFRQKTCSPMATIIFYPHIKDSVITYAELP